MRTLKVDRYTHTYIYIYIYHLLLRARRELGAVRVACERRVGRTHGHGEEQGVVVGGAAAEEVLVRGRVKG